MSSSPTKSAPAASASFALSPLAKLNSLCLPVPFGNTTAPRICWSAFRVYVQTVCNFNCCIKFAMFVSLLKLLLRQQDKLYLNQLLMHLAFCSFSHFGSSLIVVITVVPPTCSISFNIEPTEKLLS